MPPTHVLLLHVRGTHMHIYSVYSRIVSNEEQDAEVARALLKFWNQLNCELQSLTFETWYQENNDGANTTDEQDFAQQNTHTHTE